LKLYLSLHAHEYVVDWYMLELQKVIKLHLIELYVFLHNKLLIGMES